METSPPSPSANISAQPSYNTDHNGKPSHARQSKSPPMRGKRKSPPLRGKALQSEAISEDKGKAMNKQVYDNVTLSSTSLQKTQTHQILMKSHLSSSPNQRMTVISGKSSRTQTVKTK